MDRVENIEGCILTNCVSAFVVNLQDRKQVPIPAEFSRVK